MTHPAESPAMAAQHHAGQVEGEVYDGLHLHTSGIGQRWGGDGGAANDVDGCGMGWGGGFAYALHEVTQAAAAAAHVRELLHERYAVGEIVSPRAEQRLVLDGARPSRGGEESFAVRPKGLGGGCVAYDEGRWGGGGGGKDWESGGNV